MKSTLLVSQRVLGKDSDDDCQRVDDENGKPVTDRSPECILDQTGLKRRNFKTMNALKLSESSNKTELRVFLSRVFKKHMKTSFIPCL